jgi:hypothetical protein
MFPQRSRSRQGLFRVGPPAKAKVRVETEGQGRTLLGRRGVRWKQKHPSAVGSVRLGVQQGAAFPGGRGVAGVGDDVGELPASAALSYTAPQPPVARPVEQDVLAHEAMAQPKLLRCRQAEPGGRERRRW